MGGTHKIFDLQWFRRIDAARIGHTAGGLEVGARTRNINKTEVMESQGPQTPSNYYYYYYYYHYYYYYYYYCYYYYPYFASELSAGEAHASRRPRPYPSSSSHRSTNLGSLQAKN